MTTIIGSPHNVATNGDDESSFLAYMSESMHNYDITSNQSYVSNSSNTALKMFQYAMRVLESLDVHVPETTSLCTSTKSASVSLSLPVCSNVDDFVIHTTTSTGYLRRALVSTKTLAMNHVQSEIYDSNHVMLENFGKDDTERGLFLILNVLGAIICIGFVALIAGLYLGMMTLDVIDLEIIQRVSLNDDEIMYATNLLPIVKQRHRLLVTLLLINAIAYETLPIFLDNLLPQWVAILLSTTIILVFGEIVPSAIFTGPNQLMLGNMLAPMTTFFMWILSPIVTPLSSLLDYLVHGHFVNDTTKQNADFEPVYNRSELAALVRIQHESRMAAASRNNKSILLAKNQKVFKEKKMKDDSWNAIKKEIMERVNGRHVEGSERNHFNNSHHNHHNHSRLFSNTNGSGVTKPRSYSNLDELEQKPEAAVEQLHPPLHPTEVDLVTGALQMKTRLVMDEYTPLRKVYALPDNLIFDVNTIASIYAKGYSRMPVYRYKPEDPDDRTAVLGFLMIRQLIMIDWDHKRELSTMPLQRPDCISPRTNLVDALELLRTGGTLMTFVCARPEIANKALDNEDPIPVEAGFMGIITLEDVMESIIQGRVYDEWDIKDRDRAIATLHRWAATKLQNFVRRNREKIIRRNSNASLNQSQQQLQDLEQVQQELQNQLDDIYSTNNTNNNDQNRKPFSSQQNFPTNISTDTTPLLQSSRIQNSSYT